MIFVLDKSCKVEPTLLVTRAQEVLCQSQPGAKLLCLVEVAEKDRNVSLDTQKDLIGWLWTYFTDDKGVFVSPLLVECSLTPAQNSIKHQKERFVFREAKDFCCLAAKNHPSILEVFSPFLLLNSKMVFETPLFTTEEWQKLLDLRPKFLTKQAARSVFRFGDFSFVVRFSDTWPGLSDNSSTRKKKGMSTYKDTLKWCGLRFTKLKFC